MREIALVALMISSFFSSSIGLVADFNHKLTEYLTKYQTTTTAKTDSSANLILAAPTKTTVDEMANSAAAVYSVDYATNKVLDQKNQDEKLQIASLTKLMTTYTALKSMDMNATYTIPAFSLREGDAVAGLSNGERLKGIDLLAAMLINSGSDAAQSIAILDEGSLDGFVTKMNENATDLKLTNTHYTNPVGWDDASNYSSAKDVTELTRILLGNPTFASIVSQKTKTITTESGRTINLVSTNELLGSPGYLGVKTGFTNGAGECLVSLNKDGDTEVLTTILGSGNRFGETEQIISWLKSHFVWN